MIDDLLAGDFQEEPWWWHAAPRPAQSSVDNFPDRADVVVVGSGFTGLSAALTLAKAGREVVVLDAQAPGYGASSRNAGFVGRTLKPVLIRYYRPTVLITRCRFIANWTPRLILYST